MLKKYGVNDPNTNGNVGVFTGEEFGPYFSQKYGELAQGSADPLHIGAF